MCPEVAVQVSSENGCDDAAEEAQGAEVGFWRHNSRRRADPKQLRPRVRPRRRSDIAVAFPPCAYASIACRARLIALDSADPSNNKRLREG